MNKVDISRFDNVKLVIRDLYDQFLVGEKYGTSHRFSLFGGHREKKEKHWFETAKRELEEESCGLFSIEYTPDRVYQLVIQDRYAIAMKLIFIEKVKQTIYMGFEADINFANYIDDLRKEFALSQDAMVLGLLFELYDTYPDISLITWFKWVQLYDPRKTNSKLNKAYKDLDMGPKDIKYVNDRIEQIVARMEMDQINMATYQEMVASNGLYQREILQNL